MASSQPEAASTQAAIDTPPEGMVHVPGGPFLSGRRKESVHLGDFWIDAQPVTNAAYERFCAENNRPTPRHWPPDGLNTRLRGHPVVRLTYAEAQAYAESLGKQLPTPEQFEKAARGSEGRKYPWGNSVGSRVTNTRESGIQATTPVDAFPKGISPYGCFDMAGNVLHWTRGVYDTMAQTQICKGSSYKHYLGAAHFEYEESPKRRRDYVGFRCVWVPPDAER